MHTPIWHNRLLKNESFLRGTSAYKIWNIKVQITKWIFPKIFGLQNFAENMPKRETIYLLQFSDRHSPKVNSFLVLTAQNGVREKLVRAMV